MVTGVHSHYRFLDYRISLLSFEAFEPVTGASDIDYRYTIDFERAMSETFAEDTGRIAMVSLDVKVQWEPEPGPFLFHAKIHGRFGCDEAMRQEDYGNMCRVLAPALLYGQLRPVARHILQEGGHGFMLPLMNLPQTFRQADEDEAEQALLKSDTES